MNNLDSNSDEEKKEQDLAKNLDSEGKPKKTRPKRRSMDPKVRRKKVVDGRKAQKKQQKANSDSRRRKAVKLNSLLAKNEKQAEELAQKEKFLDNRQMSANEMRGAVMQLCKELDHEPLKKLILYAKNPKTPLREQVALNKYLSDKMVPDVKAVDIQADMRMNLRVEITRFGGTDQAIDIVADTAVEATDGDTT